MRIDRLEVVPFAIPFRAPYVTARGRLERRELLLLRLRAGDAEGLGEAAPLALRGGTPLAQVRDEIERSCRPRIEGAESGMEAVAPLLAACAGAGAGAQALAAIELALLDLTTRLAGRPLHQLLGARRARPVPCNATLVAGRPEAVAADAVRWHERGFRTFKLKVGVEDEEQQVHAVREALGPDARMRLDANGAWSRVRAIAMLKALEPVGIELVEQPSPTLEDLAAVRRRVAIPIAADESVASADDARRAVAAEACDVVTVKVAKVGGIAAAREVAQLVPVYLSSALDGPVGIAAAAHLAQVLPPSSFETGLAHGLATTELFADRVAERECELDDGLLALPPGPGLGVEIDERALGRLRL